MKKRFIVVLVVVCMALCGSIAFVVADDEPEEKKCEKICIKYQRKCCVTSPANWDDWCDEAEKECDCGCRE